MERIKICNKSLATLIGAQAGEDVTPGDLRRYVYGVPGARQAHRKMREQIVGTWLLRQAIFGP